jgi:hypothetical protein
VVCGGHARRTALGGRIRELTTTGGPVPSIILGHDRILRSRAPSSVVCGEHAREMVHSSCIQRLTSMKRSEACRGHGDVLFILKMCLMISDGPPVGNPKRKRSPMTREVNVAPSQAKATPVYLKWSETVITFDRTNLSNHI